MFTRNQPVMVVAVCGSFFSMGFLVGASAFTALVLNALGILGSVTVILGVPFFLMTHYLELSDQLSLRRRIHSSKDAAWSSFRIAFFIIMGIALLTATAYFAHTQLRMKQDFSLEKSLILRTIPGKTGSR